LDLLDESARESASLDYDVYAIGSPTKRMELYNYEVVSDMIVTAKRRLPASKLVHLFGGGHPMIIPFAVALGVDLFDSASYILFARDGRYMTEKGTKRLEELEYFPCSCPVCSKRSPSELKEMSEEERTRALALHNLHVISAVLRRTKQAIVEGRLWELLEEFSKGHPSLHSLLTHIARKHYVYIESRTPRVPSRPSSMFLYDYMSLDNPHAARAREFILKEYLPPPGKRVLVLKPRLTPTISDEVSGHSRDEHVVFYDHLLVVPREMSRIHPEGHAVVPKSFVYHEELYVKALMNAISYARAKRGLYDRVILQVCYEWLGKALNLLREHSYVSVSPLLCW